jgi:hypothetical protein
MKNMLNFRVHGLGASALLATGHESMRFLGACFALGGTTPLTRARWLRILSGSHLSLSLSLPAQSYPVAAPFLSPTARFNYHCEPDR